LAIVAAVGDGMRYADRHHPRLAGHQTNVNFTEFWPVAVVRALNRALSRLRSPFCGPNRALSPLRSFAVMSTQRSRAGR
jgi:hypothetical protein